MSENYDFGMEAEDKATHYLREEGYSILERNIHIGKAEVDIIAASSSMLLIIEVKARSNTYTGTPEQAVTPKKIRLLSSAADRYVTDNEIDLEVRFDIISLVKQDNQWKIKHIKDAFLPKLD